MAKSFSGQNGNRLPKNVYEFLDDVLVECPRCSRAAHVLVARPYYTMPTRLVCGGCGYSSTAPASLTSWYGSFREGCDPFFGLTLWLRERVGNRVAWAYNWRHFEDLQFFLAGEWKAHRTNLALPNYVSTWSYRTRLPKWMHEKANHPQLEKALNRIRRRRWGKS